MELLCSLGAIGELSASEQEILARHLEDCAECRATLEAFEQIASVDLAALAAEQPHSGSIPVAPEAGFGALEQRMLAKAQQAPAPVSGVSPGRNARVRRPSRRSFRFSPAWAVLAAALILVGLLSLRLRRPGPVAVGPDLRAALKQARSESADWKARVDALQAEQRLREKQQVEEAQERAALAKQLADLRAAYADLKRSRKDLEGQLAEQTAALRRQTNDLQETRASFVQEQERVDALHAALEEANAKVARARDQLARVTEASERITPEPAAPKPRISDEEARQIVGARDLHIVDVYDVDRSGHTKRTYGRVYYINHNSLLFYAFDLEDRARSRKAVAFQAWGFREPDASRPENLGLFYVDDASLNRWALRVSDARVLSRIDTVFVTLEPPQGSASPRGPKLLFASLGGPPNHP